MMIVNDCCHARNLYERIFSGVKIRLDLFHACSRIVQTISKKDSYGKQFSSELSLILRRNGDLGTERTTSTPGSDEIEANLERLLFSWKDRLPKETLHPLECLRKHIQKGVFRTYLLGVEQKRMNVYTDILIDRSSVVSWTRTRDNCNELCIVCLELQTTNKQIDLES